MYNGDIRLRGMGEVVATTEDQIKEYIRCKEDVIYFAQKYFHIVDPDKGKTIIKLRHYQKKVLKAFTSPKPTKQKKKRKHVIMLSARQSGKTTTSAIYLLHYALFHKDKTVAILANKEKTAFEILLRIKTAYQELPMWMQQGIDEQYGGWNKGSIGLESGVRIVASSTASSAIRGMSINLLFLDEFAFVPNNIADEFMGSVYPTITAAETSQIIIVSTPKGLNHFYDIWHKAIREKNGFMPVKVGWRELPGKDDEWMEDTINNIGAQKFAQEFGCKFLGSSDTLIDAEILERMETVEPVEYKIGHSLCIYEKPIPGKSYMMGVDSAKGTGNDFSVIQVLKIISEHEVKQVAVYRNNTVDTHSFAQVVISVSEYYNDCYMMVENNDVGGEVANDVWYNYEYDKILNCDKKGIGIRATKKSKLSANILLKRYLEKGWLDIVDRSTVSELSIYEEIAPNRFSAPRGSNDDCVTSLLFGLFFLSTPYFDDKTMGVKEIEDEFKLEKEDEDRPIMFFDDGNERLPEVFGGNDPLDDYGGNDVFGGDSFM